MIRSDDNQARERKESRLKESGFEIIHPFFTPEQVSSMLRLIESSSSDHVTFRKGNELFAIRKFVHEIPGIIPILFTPAFEKLLAAKAGEGYKLVKSIYFDKPGHSNWFVSYHQDLTISVREKAACEGYTAWTSKDEQYAVQPPLPILEDNVTVRIHLDDTTGNNGALKVIPKSHLNGITRYDAEQKTFTDREIICEVPLGGIMLMKPLLLHSSARTTNNMHRRVIHLEFSRASLPSPIQWAETIL